MWLGSTPKIQLRASQIVEGHRSSQFTAYQCNISVQLSWCIDAVQIQHSVNCAIRSFLKILGVLAGPWHTITWANGRKARATQIQVGMLLLTQPYS